MLSQNAFAYSDAKSAWATGDAVVFPLHAPSSGRIDKLVINKARNPGLSKFVLRFTAASMCDAALHHSCRACSARRAAAFGPVRERRFTGAGTARAGEAPSGWPAWVRRGVRRPRRSGAHVSVTA